MLIFAWGAFNRSWKQPVSTTLHIELNIEINYMSSESCKKLFRGKIRLDVALAKILSHKTLFC